MARVKDLVCGMQVEVSGARHVSQHGGQAYVFCGAGCRRAFEASPGRYLDPRHRPSMLRGLLDVIRATFAPRRG